MVWVVFLGFEWGYPQGQQSLSFSGIQSESKPTGPKPTTQTISFSFSPGKKSVQPLSKILANRLILKKSLPQTPSFFAFQPSSLPALRDWCSRFNLSKVLAILTWGLPRFESQNHHLDPPVSLASLRWANAQLAPALGLVAAGSAAGLGLGKARAPLPKKPTDRTRLNGGDVYRSVV